MAVDIRSDLDRMNDLHLAYQRTPRLDAALATWDRLVAD
jgi:hypothetical protein